MQSISLSQQQKCYLSDGLFMCSL